MCTKIYAIRNPIERIIWIEKYWHYYVIIDFCFFIIYGYSAIIFSYNKNVIN